MARIGLQGQQLAIFRQLTSHPDGAVSAERADFQHPLRPHHAHQQRQKLSLISGDVKSRQPGALIVRQHLAEQRILGN